MGSLSELFKSLESIQLTDIVIVVNIFIAVFVAYNEYKRRKTQNKADEGGAISSIADAAAKVTESSMGLVRVHELEITELKMQILSCKEEIRYYRKLLKDNNITFTNFDSRPLTPIKKEENK